METSYVIAFLILALIVALGVTGAFAIYYKLRSVYWHSLYVNYQDMLTEAQRRIDNINPERYEAQRKLEAISKILGRGA